MTTDDLLVLHIIVWSLRLLAALGVGLIICSFIGTYSDHRRREGTE